MPTISFADSSLYIALTALLVLSLAIRVVVLRVKFKVGIGDGKHPALQLAIRTHANAAEYVPLALLLLIVLENTWQQTLLTHLMGSLLFIGRALHAAGLSQSANTSAPRLLGTLFTWVMMAASALAIIVFYVLKAA
ncbi:MAPEG family protein [Dasania sp. GY-MA-18]|uniref:MAPEG family protein n=1 Tax=Dasania phycosphaerae TaxID=2950436 RepID=A0A9J6RK28_9GAMM|nr:MULTISPECIES: MAPEG family protein [Dasania]MCR8922285.1 MAPEG family protein [Dasania sp. GY-MA-18]MCZ0864713.1 MAPEG family protein [Dasania phycosphaerae]MCZ0868441.1 MAPEG family protein [Dasania phycosphaerae]